MNGKNHAKAGNKRTLYSIDLSFVRSLFLFFVRLSEQMFRGLFECVDIHEVMFTIQVGDLDKPPGDASEKPAIYYVTRAGVQISICYAIV